MVNTKKDAAKNEIASFAKKSEKLKEEGNMHFGKRQMKEALVAYQKALEMTLAGTEERASLYSNRAACFLMENRYQEAIRESTLALEASPNFKAALMRRSRAFEQIGLYDRAAADLESALKVDPSDDVRKKLAAVKTAATNSKKSARGGASAGGMGGGGVAGLGGSSLRAGSLNRKGTRLTPAQQQAAAAAAAGTGQRGGGQNQNMPMLTLNCALDGETKTIVLPIQVRYKDIVDTVAANFPNNKEPLALKYRDPEGDLMTVASRADLRSALSAAVAAAEQRAAATGKPGIPPGQLAPVDITLVKVKSAPSETPDVVTPANVGAQGTTPEEEEEEAAEDVIEIDEWLLTFAGLFRKHLGDAAAPEGPLDLRTIGLEKCCEALEVAVGTEKAKELLGAAADKFQEAAAAAIFNWGNVHVCAARKLVDTSEPSKGDGEEAGKDAAAAGAEGQPAQVPSEAAMKAAAANHMQRMDAEYEAAIERYKQSLGIKSDFYEASIAWGQQAFERGKLLHVASKEAKGADAAKYAKETDAMFKLAEAKFEESLGMLPAEEAAASTSGGDNKGGGEGGEAPAAASEEEGLSLKSQILVLWGNVLFERSQVRHHREDKKWQEDCDAAVAKFNSAGCSKSDITRALMNHTSKVWNDEKKAEEAAGGK